MKKGSHQKLLTHARPVDRQAAKELTPDQPHAVHQWHPFPPAAVPAAEIVARHAGKSVFADLSGLKVGRLWVIWLHEYRDRARSLWCVRCDCGRYVLAPQRLLERVQRKHRAVTCGACESEMAACLAWKAKHPP